MHADHSLWEIVAYVMIAFLFVFRGITAIPAFERHVPRFVAYKIPFPRLVLGGGIALMLVGGTMVGLDLYAPIGAGMLILFTIFANLLYHNFWSMTDPELHERHLYIFFNNVAVMGGLVLVMVM